MAMCRAGQFFTLAPHLGPPACKRVRIHTTLLQPGSNQKIRRVPSISHRWSQIWDHSCNPRVARSHSAPHCPTQGLSRDES